MFVVSGATGHVGSVVADKLLESNKKVRLIVRSQSKGVEWVKKGASVAVGSLENEAFLTDILEGTEGFFVLMPPNHQVENLFDWQRQIADKIANAVKKSHVPHVVLLSATGADFPEGTGPVKGLHYLEERLKATGARLTAIRAGYFQENIGPAVQAAKTAGIFPNFFESEDFLFPMNAARDVGEACANALMVPSKNSEEIALQGPAYTPRQLAQFVGDALGKRIQVVTIPAKNHLNALKESGLSHTWSESFAELYVAMGKGFLDPRDERLVRCTTPITEVIARLI